uniref:PAS domain-containing protein n=1 Tax=Pontiella sp. TaxID=2837462 RepID=UPI003566D09B
MSSELRKRAEELLRKNPLEVPVLSTVEVQQLLHELDVHQVELQMQNKELLQTQTELARSRDAYAELYDFAPVGYLTLDAENRIHEANFTAAALLGLERGKLPVGRTFAEFIHLDSRPVWEHLRQQLAEHPEKHGADLTLQRADGSLFMARVECAPRLDAAHRLERSFVTLSDVTERVVAQKELFAVFHDAPLPMMVVDRERRVRKINSAALDMARRAEQEALGLRGGEALRCVHAFDDPAGCGFGPDCQACVVRNVVQETFETRQPHHGVEAPIPYSAEGGVIPMWVLVSTAFLDLLGEERVLVCLEDITERKRAEEQLRRSVERLRMAAQAGRFGTYEANLATGEVFWSPEMRAIFGLAADVPPAHKPGTVPSFIHPQDAAEVGEWIRRSYDPSGNGAVEHEHRIVRADGSVRWVLMKGRVTFEGEGDRRRPVRSNGVVMDITARKEIELALKESETKLSLLNLGLERRVAERTAELRESEERFRILFEQAPDAEFLINFDGRFIDGNQAAEQMVGYRREELVGLPMLEFGILDEGSRATAAANLAELAQGEQVPPAEFLVRHKDGTAIPVEISCMTVHIEGRPVVLGSARDLTARKQAERALEESHQLLRSIIDTMHERVWWKDLNSAFLGCNLNVVRDAGLEHPDEIVGKTDYDFCWKQQADRYLADDREVIESGTPKLGILECQ